MEGLLRKVPMDPMCEAFACFRARNSLRRSSTCFLASGVQCRYSASSFVLASLAAQVFHASATSRACSIMLRCSVTCASASRVAASSWLIHASAAWATSRTSSRTSCVAASGSSDQVTSISHRRTFAVEVHTSFFEDPFGEIQRIRIVNLGGLGVGHPRYLRCLFQWNFRGQGFVFLRCLREEATAFFGGIHRCFMFDLHG